MHVVRICLTMMLGFGAAAAAPPERSNSAAPPASAAEPVDPASLMREKKFAEAAAEFRRLDAAETDAKRSAAARVNLGYCLVQQSSSLAPDRPGEKIPLLSQAIDSYKAALRADPNDATAGKDLEIAKRLLKEAQHEQQKQQQQQQQQQEQKNDDQQSQNQRPQQNDSQENPDQDQGNQQSQSQDRKDQADSEPGDSARQSAPRRPVDRMVQQLLDREKQQRAVLNRFRRDQRTKPVPVEKDW